MQKHTMLIILCPSGFTLVAFSYWAGEMPAGGVSCPFAIGHGPHGRHTFQNKALRCNGFVYLLKLYFSLVMYCIQL